LVRVVELVPLVLPVPVVQLMPLVEVVQVVEVVPLGSVVRKSPDPGGWTGLSMVQRRWEFPRNSRRSPER
jgi:hypothetical protein